MTTIEVTDGGEEIPLNANRLHGIRIPSNKALNRKKIL